MIFSTAVTAPSVGRNEFQPQFCFGSLLCRSGLFWVAFAPIFNFPPVAARTLTQTRNSKRGWHNCFSATAPTCRHWPFSVDVFIRNGPSGGQLIIELVVGCFSPNPLALLAPTFYSSVSPPDCIYGIVISQVVGASLHPGQLPQSRILATIIA